MDHEVIEHEPELDLDIEMHSDADGCHAEDMPEVAQSPGFTPRDKAVLTKEEMQQAMVARIREVELGQFKDEMTVYECSVIAPNAKEAVEAGMRVDLASTLLHSLVNAHNELYGG